MHGQPGSCSLWSLVCIEYETESEASEGHVELQPRSDRINSEDQTCSRVEDRLETVEEVGTCPIEKAVGEIDSRADESMDQSLDG